MEDIIYSVPVATQRDRDGTAVSWAIEHYWCYDNGTYSVCDDSGNHDDVDEADLPTSSEHDARWLEYHQFVADTGTDPLCEFLVQRSKTVTERWSFRISPSILGPVLVSTRRGASHWVSSQDLPAHVRTYLKLPADRLRRPVLPLSWDALAEVGVRPGRWFTDRITRTVARPEETVTAELRLAARKAVRRSRAQARAAGSK